MKVGRAEVGVCLLCKSPSQEAGGWQVTRHLPVYLYDAGGGRLAIANGHHRVTVARELGEASVLGCVFPSCSTAFNEAQARELEIRASLGWPVPVQDPPCSPDPVGGELRSVKGLSTAVIDIEDARMAPPGRAQGVEPVGVHVPCMHLPF